MPFAGRAMKMGSSVFAAQIVAPASDPMAVGFARERREVESHGVRGTLAPERACASGDHQVLDARTF
jgi:hypothetical protein